MFYEIGSIYRPTYIPELRSSRTRWSKGHPEVPTYSVPFQISQLHARSIVLGPNTRLKGIPPNREEASIERVNNSTLGYHVKYYYDGLGLRRILKTAELLKAAGLEHEEVTEVRKLDEVYYHGKPLDFRKWLALQRSITHKNHVNRAIREEGLKQDRYLKKLELFTVTSQMPIPERLCDTRLLAGDNCLLVAPLTGNEVIYQGQVSSRQELADEMLSKPEKFINQLTADYLVPHSSPPLPQLVKQWQAELPLLAANLANPDAPGPWVTSCYWFHRLLEKVFARYNDTYSPNSNQAET